MTIGQRGLEHWRIYGCKKIHLRNLSKPNVARKPKATSLETQKPTSLLIERNDGFKGRKPASNTQWRTEVSTAEAKSLGTRKWHLAGVNNFFPKKDHWETSRHRSRLRIGLEKLEGKWFVTHRRCPWAVQASPKAAVDLYNVGDCSRFARPHLYAKQLRRDSSKALRIQGQALSIFLELWHPNVLWLRVTKLRFLTHKHPTCSTCHLLTPAWKTKKWQTPTGTSCDPRKGALLVWIRKTRAQRCLETAPILR